jgi:glycosyltransferase involved in cell wall biosynthesis
MKKSSWLLITRINFDHNTPYYGLQNHTFNFAKWLVKCGFEVEVICKSENSYWKNDGIVFRGFSSVNEIVKFIIFKKTDVAIGINNALVFFMLSAKKYLIYQHNSELPKFIKSAFVYRKSKIIIICPSQNTKDILINKGINQDQILINRNFLVQDFEIKDNNVNRTPHRLIFAGTITKYKGVDNAIKSTKKVHQIFSDVELLIIGGVIKPAFNDEDFLLKNGDINYQKIMSEYPWVKFLGYLPRNELLKEFHEAGYLLCPSENIESFGLVSIEAQSCGCLPIVSKNSGLYETIKENKTGFSYYPNDPNTLSEKIISIFNRPEITNEFRMNSSILSSQIFNIDLVLSELLEKIKSIPVNSLFQIIRNQILIYIINTIFLSYKLIIRYFNKVNTNQKLDKL